MPVTCFAAKRLGTAKGHVEAMVHRLLGVVCIGCIMVYFIQCDGQCIKFRDLRLRYCKLALEQRPSLAMRISHFLRVLKVQAGAPTGVALVHSVVD